MPRDTVALWDAPAEVTTLEGLAWRLRHPETWPKGFVWNFEYCHTCAMGLLWMELAGAPVVGNFCAQTKTQEFYGLDENAAFDIFQRAPDDNCARITPEMVALRIDAYLARERTNAV